MLVISDAFAQMGSFPGDSTRGLLSNISDVEPISITTNQTTGLSTYTNSEHGFEFDFPSTWEALQVMNMNPTWIEGLPTEIARIGSPAEQGIHDLVTIGMLKPEEGTYLDTEEMVVKTRNSQEHARVWTNVLQQGGVELVRENAVTVSGLPAWRIEYTGIDYNTEIFVVKEDGTMYNIKFRTPMLKAPESLPIFDRIVESFRFVDSSGVQQPQTNQKTTSGSMGSELNAQPQVPNSNFLMPPLSGGGVLKARVIVLRKRCP